MRLFSYWLPVIGGGILLSLALAACAGRQLPLPLSAENTAEIIFAPLTSSHLTVMRQDSAQFADLIDELNRCAFSDEVPLWAEDYITLSTINVDFTLADGSILRLMVNDAGQATLARYHRNRWDPTYYAGGCDDLYNSLRLSHSFDSFDNSLGESLVFSND